MIDDGGQVYPIQSNYPNERERGITRRDWLAGLAMGGMLANAVSCQEQSDISAIDGRNVCEIMSHIAYNMGDAMIAEGRKETK